jgi:hypothetical protein
MLEQLHIQIEINSEGNTKLNIRIKPVRLLEGKRRKSS